MQNCKHVYAVHAQMLVALTLIRKLLFISTLLNFCLVQVCTVHALFPVYQALIEVHYAWHHA